MPDVPTSGERLARNCFPVDVVADGELIARNARAVVTDDRLRVFVVAADEPVAVIDEALDSPVERDRGTLRGGSLRVEAGGRCFFVSSTGRCGCGKEVAAVRNMSVGASW